MRKCPGSERARTWCNHADRVPVESVAGELVAQLCLTCDAQLSVEFATLFDPNPLAAIGDQAP